MKKALRAAALILGCAASGYAGAVAQTSLFTGTKTGPLGQDFYVAGQVVMYTRADGVHGIFPGMQDIVPDDTQLHTYDTQNNPNFSGTVNVGGISPEYALTSDIYHIGPRWWLDRYGNSLHATNKDSAAEQFFTQNGSYYFNDSLGPVIINLQSAGNASPRNNPVQIRQEADGTFNLTGDGTHNMNLNPGNGRISIGGYPILPNAFMSDTSQCGSISGSDGCFVFVDGSGDAHNLPTFKH